MGMNAGVVVVVNALFVGAFAYASIHHLYLWQLSRRARLPLLVAIYCGLSALLGISLVRVGTATTLSDAQNALDARTITGVLSIAALGWMISGLTGVAARRYLIGMSVLMGLGLVAQMAGYRIAGTVTGISHVPMPWGETITVLDRQPSARWFAALMYSGVMSVYVFAVFAGVRSFRRDRVAGVLTATAGVFGVLIIPVSGLIDMGLIRAPYFGHIGNIIWVLLTTFLMAREHAAREEQLRQSQKMEAIGQLAGGVAHDFNNLLTVIAGYSEILQTKLPPSDPRHGLAKAIGDATERAAWLTARLLAFGRRSVLAPEVIDLNTLVRDTERILRRLIDENIGLRIELAPEALHVELDPGQWSQVVLNLAVNARDAMPGGGSLIIGTAAVDADARFLAAHPSLRAGRYSAFSVADTGHGMPPEIAARIFEPFFTTKEMGKGTGLGLAVVHGIVTQGGGAIDVTSTPGAGTRFDVYLPAVEAVPAHAGDDYVPAHPGAGETILLVEDDDNVRELLEAALSAQGYRVFGAGHGDDALRLLEGPCPSVDLLLTDIVMPGRVSGKALAETVRQRFPQVKVLFMSGYIDDPAIRSSGFGSEEEYLQKPFSLASIAQKTREMLDRE